MRVLVGVIAMLTNACLLKPDEPAAASCDMLAVRDDFTQPGTPCSPWGSTFGDPFVQQSNGALRISLSNGAGCTTRTYASLEAFVEVSEVFTQGIGAYTLLKSFAGNATGTGIGVFGDGQLSVQDDTGNPLMKVPYDPATMHWWRLRSVNATDIVGEYSADGRSWSMLGVRTATGPPQKVVLIAGGPVGTLGAAVFEGFNACP